MHDYAFYSALQTQIIKIINENDEFEDTVKNLLINELKLDKHDRIYHCQCGYPLGYTRYNGREDEFRYLENILEHETDFRSYKIFLICPKCKREILEIQG